VLAHVLTGGPVPVPLQWLLAAALFAGALLAFTLRRRRLRRIAAAVSALGLLGTVGNWVVAATQPGAPPYAIRIVSPAADATVPETVLLTVCGVQGDGTTVPSTDSQHYLVVYVDGREAPVVDASQFPEVLSPGPHTITVQLVTPSRQAFSPPATASIQLTASPGATPPAPAPC
jgi:hypothetical protein